MDRWGMKKYCASWSIETAIGASSHNTRYLELWDATLEAWRALVRPTTLAVQTLDLDAGQTHPERVEWKTDEPHAAFLARCRDTIAAYGHPIADLDASVDLLAYARHEGSPHRPERFWMRLGDDFSIAGEPGADTLYLSFSLGHTLFAAESDYGDNGELWSLNQPLLERALRQWERSLGEIIDVEGLSSVYTYGFLRETDSHHDEDGP